MSIDGGARSIRLAVFTTSIGTSARLKRRWERYRHDMASTLIVTDCFQGGEEWTTAD